MPISGLEIDNIIVIFGTSVLEFVSLQSYKQTPKSLNLGTKMADLGTFGLEVENCFVIFEISTLDFV